MGGHYHIGLPLVAYSRGRSWHLAKPKRDQWKRFKLGEGVQVGIKPAVHKENKEKLTRQEEKQLILFYDCLKREVSELGFNLWGILNGVTRYTSNHLTGNKGFGVVNGRGERLNRQAMNYLMSLT